MYNTKIVHTWPNSLYYWTKSDFFESLQYSLPDNNYNYISNSINIELTPTISIKELNKFYKIDNKNWSFTYVFPWKYWFICKWDYCFVDEIYKNKKIDIKILTENEILVLKKLIYFWCIISEEIPFSEKGVSADGLFKKKTLFYLSLTNRCNLACPFCVANANTSICKDSTDDMVKIIEWIEWYLSTKRSNWIIYKIGITWWEPFIRHDIFHLLENIKTHDNVEYNITTNWTLLNNNLLSLIKKNKINLIFSIDWPNESDHDFFRWKGNFKKTIDSINEVKKMGIPFFINSFLYEWNLKTVKDRIVLFDNSWCQWINFLNSFWRWRDSNFYYKEADEEILFDTIYQFLKENPTKTYLFNNISLFYSIFLRIISWAKLNHSWSWYAEPMMIWSNWKIYITPSLFNNEKYYLWNILENNLEEILMHENKYINEIKNRDIDNIKIDNDDFNALKYFFWWENISENVIFWEKLHPSYINRIKTIKKVFQILSENPIFGYNLLCYNK